MKTSTVVSAMAASALCASAAFAADVWVGVDYESAYVPSGTTCNDGSVLWPCVEVSGMQLGETKLPLVVGFWGNIDLDDSFDPAYHSGRFSEIDVWANIDVAQILETDLFKWYVGYLEYDYPNIGAETDNLLDSKIGCSTPFFDPSLRLKWRLGGPSSGMYELIATVSRDIPLGGEKNAEGKVVSDWVLGLSADCTYIHQPDGSEKDDGLACSFFTVKLGWKDFYVAGSYVAQWDDEVLPDATDENPYGYDVEWIAAAGWGHSF